MKHLPALLAVFCLAGPAPSAACDTGSIDRRERVVYVHDGDTVKLADGTKVRLIGLDTPELKRDRRPAEPLAEAARGALRRLIEEDPRVGLQYGRERRDRYDRRLAYLVLADGRHAARILLEQGLASLLVLPPNTRYAECYAAAQRRAREHKRGVWALPAYRPIAPDAVDSLTLPAYRLVQGTVSGRSRNEDVEVIKLSGRKTTLRLVIRNDEREYFKPVLDTLVPGRRAEVQGWINPSRRRGYFMRLRHPTALQIPPP